MATYTVTCVYIIQEKVTRKKSNYVLYLLLLTKSEDSKPLIQYQHRESSTTMDKLINLQAGDCLILGAIEHTINVSGIYHVTVSSTPEGLVKPQDLEVRRANAKSMAWLHDKEQAVERRIELLTLIRDQFRESVKGPPNCVCCSVVIQWRNLFRCFYCDLWFCLVCARLHFGKIE